MAHAKEENESRDRPVTPRISITTLSIVPYAAPGIRDSRAPPSLAPNRCLTGHRAAKLTPVFLGASRAAAVACLIRQRPVGLSLLSTDLIARVRVGNCLQGLQVRPHRLTEAV